MHTLTQTGNRITYSLLIIQSLFSAAMIMTFTVASIIAVQLAGGNEQWTGIPSTLTMIGAAMVAYPIGRLIDTRGYRFSLGLGYLTGAICMVIAGAAIVGQSLGGFMVGMFILGLTRGIVGLGRYAAAEANPPEQRARAISLVVLGGTVGSIGGPILINVATKMAEWLTLPPVSGPWLLGGLSYLMAFILSYFLMWPEPQQLGRELEPEKFVPLTDTPGGRSFWEVWQDSEARLAINAMIFGQLSMVLVMTVTPVHMHHNHHEIPAISFVIMMHTLGMFGFSFLTGWLVDKWGALWIIILGGVVSAAACLLAPLVTSVNFLALALFLLGLGWNFCFVAGSSLLAERLQPHEKGRIQGLADGWVNFASGLGSLGGGFLFAALGFWLMSWLTILFTLPPLVQIAHLKIIRN